MSIGPVASSTEWHLFGSVNRDDMYASDIDLMILCKTDDQADMLRKALAPISLTLPLHLSLFTFEEAATIDAPKAQDCALFLALGPQQ